MEDDYENRLVFKTAESSQGEEMKEFDYIVEGDNVELFHVHGIAAIILPLWNTDKPTLSWCSYRITSEQFELLKKEIKFQERSLK